MGREGGIASYKGGPRSFSQSLHSWEGREGDHGSWEGKKKDETGRPAKSPPLEAFRFFFGEGV
jgi:hypothetical protein